ncbi:HmuY family protein [Chitinophaga sp. NPDC101104]|uniref:HmuY family protein n=1 Tax=Chitinophaga sp. NPDC101104 TaxID=3390561 RepID=UPI003D058825
MKTKLLSLLAIVLLAACSKDDAPPKPEEPGGSGGNPVKTGTYRVVNLVADTNATSAGDAVSLYYSLEENRVVSASQRQTGNWDIVFYGIYNSSIYPNNGNATGSPGFGGPGKAEIAVIVDRKFDAAYYDTIHFKPTKLPIPAALWSEAFNKVTAVSAGLRFVTRDIGLDHFLGGFDGWGYYDFYGSLFPGNPQKAHVVYTLPRVMIVKTHKGRYAKLIMESIYKGSPPNPDRTHKPGYITFRYSIQMDGSTNLNIP